MQGLPIGSPLWIGLLPVQRDFFALGGEHPVGAGLDPPVSAGHLSTPLNGTR